VLELPDDDSMIPPGTAIALYRIVQEALTNIVKYARARTVSVDLMIDNSAIALVIGDDGVGITDSAQDNRLAHGIVGMRQRVSALGGEFSIGRGSTGGTQIEVNVPLVEEAHGPAGRSPGA
jgi:signal transduction histidine kinase